MTLQACNECGQQVSTLASSCPHCGAPQLPNGPSSPSPVAWKSRPKAILGLVAIGVVALVFSAVFDSSRAPVAAAHSPAPQPPAAGQDVEGNDAGEPAALVATHNYQVMEDGEYGYEPGISDADRQAGTVVKPMIMIRFIGTTDGVTKFSQADGATWNIYTCTGGCDIVKSSVYFRGELVRQETMRVVPGSIIYGVVEDIVNGRLAQYRKSGKSSAS